MLYVLGTGQSNWRGRYKGGPAFATATRVSVWNNENPLGANGTAWVSPTEGGHPFNTDGSNNSGLWCCHRITQELDDDVRMVSVSRDSSDISYWDPSGGAVYQEIVDVYGASGAPAADLLLYHQGENGFNKATWLSFRNALRTAGILKADAPAIVGGLQGVRIGGPNDSLLQELAAENDDVYYASSASLDDGGDGLHFAGPDLYTFGYFRYWDQYRAHIGTKPRVTGPAMVGPPRIW